MDLSSDQRWQVSCTCQIWALCRVVKEYTNFIEGGREIKVENLNYKSEDNNKP